MRAGAGDTVQTNPQAEDARRGDAQRMLTNEAVLSTMCFTHSESPVPHNNGAVSQPRKIVAGVRPGPDSLQLDARCRKLRFEFIAAIRQDPLHRPAGAPAPGPQPHIADALEFADVDKEA